MLLLETGQAVQPHVEDRLRLHFRQSIPTVHQAHLAADAVRSRMDVPCALQHFGDRHQIPKGVHAAPSRASAGDGRALDRRDDLVDVGERHGQAFEDVGTLARLAQIEDRASRDDFTPMAYERFEQLLERQTASADPRRVQPC